MKVQSFYKKVEFDPKMKTKQNVEFNPYMQNKEVESSP